MNRLRECFREFHTRDRALMVESFMIWHRNGDLDMDPVYQRDYVWTQKEQDSFLVTLVRGFPIGVIAISDDIEFKETKWIEVIDGKQRLTTLIKFIDGEIGIPMPDGSRLYWDKMTRSEQLRFRGIPMPALDLHECNAKDRLEFFYRTNFAGVPQSEEHKENYGNDEMKVNTKSWHYRLNLWRHPKWKVESKNTLCSYFWFTVWNLVVISFITSAIIFVFYMVGYGVNEETAKYGYDALSIPYIGNIIVPFLGLIFVACVVSVALSLTGIVYYIHTGIIKFQNREKPHKDKKSKQSGLVSSYIKAKKEKFCPIIEFKD